MDFSIYEALSWVLLSVKKGVAAQIASNFLLVLYVISYLRIKNAAFLVAFLLIELYGNLYITDNLSAEAYYLGYAFIYSLIYWYAFHENYKLKIVAGYGILILFEFIMCLDAIYYPNTETYIYTGYANIIVFIHLYIITQTINWRKLRASMGASINALGRVLGVNYNLSFFWYNIENTSKATSKR